MFKSFSWSLKSTFSTKLATSPLVATFACFNLAVKVSAVNLLNSVVVIYLLWLDILFSTALKAVLVVTKLVILGVSLLTSFILALRETMETKLVTLGISYLTSFILASRIVLVATLVTSVIWSSILLILALYTSF